MSKEKIDIGNHLSETATLVRFTTKFWSGIKSDKFLEKKLVESTNCDKGSVNAQKYLVGKEYAKHFRSIINQVRNEYYYPLTLAWDEICFKAVVKALIKSNDNGLYFFPLVNSILTM